MWRLCSSVLFLALPLVSGCFTPQLWVDAAGGVARVQEQAAIGFDDPTGRPRTLFVRYDGGGLGGGSAYIALPLDADGDVTGQPDAGLVGLTLYEIERLGPEFDADVAGRLGKSAASRPVRPGRSYDLALQNADDFRRTRRLKSGPLPTAEPSVGKVNAAKLNLDAQHVAIAYWVVEESPPGPEVTASKHLDAVGAMRKYAIQDGRRPPAVWEALPGANAVEIVRYRDSELRRAEHVAVLPKTLRRSAGRRAASTAGAVALTPLAVAGDAAGVAAAVVTSPLWLPPLYVAVLINPPWAIPPRRPPPWHPPLVLQAKDRQ